MTTVRIVLTPEQEKELTPIRLEHPDCFGGKMFAVAAQIRVGYMGERSEVVGALISGEAAELWVSKFRDALGAQPLDGPDDIRWRH